MDSGQKPKLTVGTDGRTYTASGRPLREFTVPRDRSLDDPCPHKCRGWARYIKKGGGTDMAPNGHNPNCPLAN